MHLHNIIPQNEFYRNLFLNKSAGKILLQSFQYLITDFFVRFKRSYVLLSRNRNCVIDDLVYIIYILSIR